MDCNLFCFGWLLFIKYCDTDYNAQIFLHFNFFNFLYTLVWHTHTRSTFVQVVLTTLNRRVTVKGTYPRRSAIAPIQTDEPGPWAIKDFFAKGITPVVLFLWFFITKIFLMFLNDTIHLSKQIIELPAKCFSIFLELPCLFPATKTLRRKRRMLVMMSFCDAIYSVSISSMVALSSVWFENLVPRRINHRYEKCDLYNWPQFTNK